MIKQSVFSNPEIDHVARVDDSSGEESGMETMPVPEDLNSLILKHALSTQDEFRQQVVELAKEVTVQKEQVANVKDDIAELKKTMTEIKEEILKNQQRKFTQTIALQGTILVLILSAFLSYIIPLVFHH